MGLQDKVCTPCKADLSGRIESFLNYVIKEEAKLNLNLKI
jgi:hypothetical protein